MDQIIITVGRNVPGHLIDTIAPHLIEDVNGTARLTSDTWSTFVMIITDVVDAFSITANANGWTERHTGVGHWDGIAEESTRIAFTYDHTIVDAQDISDAFRNLTDDLISIANRFGQDAIALTRGTSSLINRDGTVSA